MPVLMLPVGHGYDPLDRVVLDPDAQVQRSIRMLFDTFARTGSARSTVRYFRSEGLDVPRRPHRGAEKGQLRWQPATHPYVLNMLHNPRYAGAYAYGRNRRRRRPDGSVRSERMPIREWTVLLRDAHPGYIAWDRFEAHQRQLRDNAPTRGHRGPPREGTALLQGLALCGVCGRTMTVRYHLRRDRRVPDYVCQGDFRQTASGRCQSIAGAGIDHAVGALLVELMTPVTLTMTLKVQDELAARAAEADAWRAQAVERARGEEQLARRRFMSTHPDNRLVADVLEAEWNARLRASAPHNGATPVANRSPDQISPPLQPHRQEVPGQLRFDNPRSTCSTNSGSPASPGRSTSRPPCPTSPNSCSRTASRCSSNARRPTASGVATRGSSATPDSTSTPILTMCWQNAHNV